MSTTTIDQLCSVATDAHAKLDALRAEYERAETIRADLMTDADPDEIDDIVTLDEVVALAARKVEIQTEIAARAAQAVVEAERAAAVASATQQERSALIEYLDILNRADAALVELEECQAALPALSSRVNQARRITGHKQRFHAAHLPPRQHQRAVRAGIDRADYNVRVELGRSPEPTDVAAN